MHLVRREMKGDKRDNVVVRNLLSSNTSTGRYPNEAHAQPSRIIRVHVARPALRLSPVKKHGA